MPATAERLPAKYLVKQEGPKIISSPDQHQAYISRLLELQRKAHRSAEETETAKLLVVLIADYEAKHFLVEKASGVEQLVAKAHQPKSLLQFFRESPLVGVALDLERQKDEGCDIEL